MRAAVILIITALVVIVSIVFGPKLRGDEKPFKIAKIFYRSVYVIVVGAIMLFAFWTIYRIVDQL